MLFDLLVSNIENSEPGMIPPVSLSESDASINNLISQLNSYKENGNIAHLQKAINLIGISIGHFPRPYNIDNEQDSKRLFSDLSAKNTEIFDETDSQISSIRKELNAVDERANEINSLLDSEKERIQSSLTNFEDQFRESQNSRSASFNSALEKFNESIASATEEVREQTQIFYVTESNKLLSIIDDRLQKADETIDDINEKHSEILKLYGLVGRDAQIGGYKENADQAGKAAKFWDVVAFVSMVIAIAVLVGPSIISYFLSGFSSIDWVQILSRLPLTGVLLLPAGYAAAQARRQKKAYDAAKRNQLHMAALGPYLSTLPQHTRDRIRAMLTPRFFTVDNPETLNVDQLFSALEEEQSVDK